MKLFKIIFEVRYPQEKPIIFKFREKILSKISEGEKQPDFQDGIQVLLKDKHIKVVVDSKRFGMDLAFNSSMPNAKQYGKDNIIKLIKLINSELDVKNVERIGLRTAWLHEVDDTPEELIEKFKDKFFKENEIVDASKDVALVFTYEDRGIKVNYNAGPMDKEQAIAIWNSSLQSVGYSNIENIKTSVFLDYDYFYDKKVGFSEDFYKNFVEKAIDEAEKTMKKTCNILEVL